MEKNAVDEVISTSQEALPMTLADDVLWNLQQANCIVFIL